METPSVKELQDRILTLEANCEIIANESQRLRRENIEGSAREIRYRAALENCKFFFENANTICSTKQFETMAKDINKALSTQSPALDILRKVRSMLERIILQYQNTLATYGYDTAHTDTLLPELKEALALFNEVIGK